MIATHVNHIVDCIRMSISRVFSREVHQRVYMQIADYIRTSVSRGFSREIHQWVYMESTSHANNQYTYVLIHLTAAAVLSHGKICWQKFPLKFRSDSRGARFQSIRCLAVKLLADRVIATNYEWRISYRFHDINSIDSHMWYGIKENIGNTL